MKVIKPERAWEIEVRLSSFECPYLVRLAEYWGCAYPFRVKQNEENIPPCDEDECLFRVKLM